MKVSSKIVKLKCFFDRIFARVPSLYNKGERDNINIGGGADIHQILYSEWRPEKKTQI